jgi:type IV secretion system protein VirB8
MFKFGKKTGESKTIKQIKNWYQDRYETILIQRNVLFILLTILVFVFSFSILSFIELNKKKVYEPFVIQVEEQTGTITRVDSRTVKDLKAEEALRNSILVRYLNAREGYHYSDYAYNYNQIVRVISSPQVFDQFLGMVSAQNPTSPIHFENEYKVEVKIKSIVNLSNTGGIIGGNNSNLIQIRIAKQKRSLSTDKIVEEKSYIITLTYEYKDIDLSETARYINPLGMQINSYQINEEPNVKNI